MSEQDKVQRTVLPIPDQPHVGLTTYDAKDPDTKYPPIRQLRPPSGAPNVLIVLIDDVGYGASSAFGGPCQTPNFEKLGANGLRFTRFHTTALCSPTRQAMLTGRNHHSVGMGGITEIATSAPGYNSILPNTCAPLARTLKLNGYSTAQFGKCHEVPVWQTSPMGPFDAWPTGGGGFEYFYGFIGGETNQYYRDFARAMREIGYNGYISYELCHQLPVVNGETVGIEFAHKNAQLAAEFMREIVKKECCPKPARARRRRSSALVGST